MRNRSLIFPCAALIAVGIFAACAPDPPLVSSADAYVPYGATRVPNLAAKGSGQTAAAAFYSQFSGPSTASLSKNNYPSPPSVVTKPSKSPSSLYREVGVKKNYLSYRARGRSRKAMDPKYITIHSTQNWSRGADANRHACRLASAPRLQF